MPAVLPKSVDMEKAELSRVLRILANRPEPSNTVVVGCDKIRLQENAKDLVYMLRDAARRDFPPLTLWDFALESARLLPEDANGYDIVFLQRKSEDRLNVHDCYFFRSLPRTHVVAPAWMEMPRRMRKEFFAVRELSCCSVM